MRIGETGVQAFAIEYECDVCGARARKLAWSSASSRPPTGWVLSARHPDQPPTFHTCARCVHEQMMQSLQLALPFSPACPPPLGARLATPRDVAPVAPLTIQEPSDAELDRMTRRFNESARRVLLEPEETEPERLERLRRAPPVRLPSHFVPADRPRPAADPDDPEKTGN